MKLKVLPSNIANMIAAGEVVQRPSSVVKELVENAVDSGADNIIINIVDAGRTLIQIIDNGCGMTEEEAALCFKRHATSKISDIKDILSISTFGFRGEALPSISSVSDIVIKTRTSESDLACELEIIQSKINSKKEIAAAVGTNISVKNLFYNIPARRKFLKSDNIELKHIVEEFYRVALTRTDISFSLNHNGKNIQVIPKAKSLKYRISDLLGSNVAKDLLEIEAKTTVVSISGFIAKPDSAKKTLSHQYLFVNGRFFKSNYISRAIMTAYENVIPEGYNPSYFIFLKLNQETIDINIHPTKTEVKFEEDNLIYQILAASVRECLGKNSFTSSIDFSSREDSIQLPIIGKNFESFRPSFSPHTNVSFDYNPFDNPPMNSRDSFIGLDEAEEQKNDLQHNECLFDTIEYKQSPEVIMVNNRYLCCYAQGNLMIISVKRAKERIFYERFLKAMTKKEYVCQSSLFPIQINIGVQNVLIFEDRLDLLCSLGFDISIFGKDTIMVNGVPDGYSNEPSKVETMINDLILILSEENKSLSELMNASFAEKLANLSSLSSNEIHSSFEAQSLIEMLFSCENAEFTSKGKRIIKVISESDLNNFFS